GDRREAAHRVRVLIEQVRRDRAVPRDEMWRLEWHSRLELGGDLQHLPQGQSLPELDQHRTVLQFENVLDAQDIAQVPDPLDDLPVDLVQKRHQTFTAERSGSFGQKVLAGAAPQAADDAGTDLYSSPAGPVGEAADQPGGPPQAVLLG